MHLVPAMVLEKLLAVYIVWPQGVDTAASSEEAAGSGTGASPARRLGFSRIFWMHWRTSGENHNTVLLAVTPICCTGTSAKMELMGSSSSNELKEQVKYLPSSTFVKCISLTREVVVAGRLAPPGLVTRIFRDSSLPLSLAPR